MTVSIACNGAGNRDGQRRLADGRLVGQLAALAWTVARSRHVLLHVLILLHQQTLVESSWIAHRHVTYTLHNAPSLRRARSSKGLS